MAAISTKTLPAGISLCMIVKDEERFLDAALRSIAGVVDEICVVDTGSTDRTREIARAHGARVLDIVWSDDFAVARNAALELATRRWIFVLDADERLDPTARAPLAAFGKTPVDGRGKWITCRNLTDSDKGSGAMTNALVRFFPNDPRIRYRNPIHEFVSLDGSQSGLPADRTAIEIVHHGYLSTVVTQRGKGERNLRLSRLAVERDPDDAFNQYNLGMAALLCGKHEDAIVALDRMRELTRLTPRGYRVHALVVLADLYAEYRHDPQTAQLLVRECLGLVPTYSNAHYCLGKLLARAGDLFEARNAFGRAIAAGEHDREQFVVDTEIALWKAQSEIGVTLIAERRYAQALAWFELGARARPSAQPLVFNRAKCHEALGELDAARALLGAAFAAYRDEASSIEWINFLLRTGNSNDACDAIEHALAFAGVECQALLLATAAASHLRDGRPQTARSALERAVACGDRTTSIAIVKALATRLDMRELCALLPGPPRVRANGLRIAYAR